MKLRWILPLVLSTMVRFATTPVGEAPDLMSSQSC